MTAFLDPSQTYCVLAHGLDYGEHAAFLARLRQAREFVARVKWVEDQRKPSLERQGFTPYTIKFEGPVASSDIFYNFNIEFSAGGRTHDDFQMSLCIVPEDPAHRRITIVEPASADFSNLPPFSSFQTDEKASETFTALIDRWIAIASNPLWMTSPAYTAFNHDIWKTVYALFASDGIDEIYPLMVARLGIRCGPHRPTQLVPLGFSDDLYNVDEFLTPHGSAILGTLVPDVVSLAYEPGARPRYTFGEHRFSERTEDIVRRDAGGVIETMKRIAPFSAHEPILVRDVHIPEPKELTHA